MQTGFKTIKEVKEKERREERYREYLVLYLGLFLIHFWAP